jgi:valyl-tRNA synthetase
VLVATIDGVEPPRFVGRLSRLEFDNTPVQLRSGREDSDMDASSAPPHGGAEPIAAVGAVRILASDQLDADAVAKRLGRRREELRAEVERGERKLGNEGFLAKAPAAVVEEERGKLERYRAELAELA